MPNLILIRHSISKLDPNLPPQEWDLTEEGRQLCILLAEQVQPYHPDVIVTSEEFKAQQTGQIVAEVLGLPCYVAQGLHEHRRERNSIMGVEQFREKVATLFAWPDQLVFGLETAHQALDRFTGAVESVLAQHPQENVVIVSHGTVLALFYGHITGIDAHLFWQTLGLPAFYVVARPDYWVISTTTQLETS